MSVKPLLPFFFLLLWPFCISAQPYIAGTSYFSTDSLIWYRAGSLPLILSAPHGGYLEPDSIPDRTCTGCSLLRDSYTQEMANELYDAIQALTGCTPHLVINRLHRKKLDANRGLPEATDGNPQAEPAWYAFHAFMGAAVTQVTADYGRGLFLDLHGHAHDIQRLELGYLLSGSELRDTDASLNTPALIDDSSIQALVYNNINSIDHTSLIRGMQAFGSLIHDRGYPAVPSQADPFPMVNESYFSGGYNTNRYSSINGGQIDGIQIECNQDVRFTTATRLDFVDSLAQSILDYFEIHYFPGFSKSYCGEGADVIADSSGIMLLQNKITPLILQTADSLYQVEILDATGTVIQNLPVLKHYYWGQQSFPQGVFWQIGHQALPEVSYRNMLWWE